MAEIRRAPREQLDMCLAIRHEVFVLGLGVPPALEADGRDLQCTHFLAWERGHTVGTARLRLTPEGEARGERVAVRPGYQGRGIGSRLVRALEAEALELGYSALVVSTPVAVVPLYEQLGYRLDGAPYIEASLRHQRVVRPLGEGL